jgi:hypothetical protein
VIQSHYVNTTRRDMVVADVARFTFARNPSQVTEVSYLILNHAAVNVPARSPATFSVQCSPDLGRGPINLLNMLGHMHEWGTSIRVERERSGTTEMLYEERQWRPEYRDEPPLRHWPSSAPLQVMPGDRLRLECNFNNNTTKPLLFPGEMCTAVMTYFPARPSRLVLCESNGT